MELHVADRNPQTTQSGSALCLVFVFPTRRSMKIAYLNGRALLDRRYVQQGRLHVQVQRT